MWMEAGRIKEFGLTGTAFRTADGPVQALTSVDLSIAKGEFVSFIGPSGCGKTTFLRVIADLEKPTEGTITLNGTELEIGVPEPEVPASLRAVRRFTPAKQLRLGGTWYRNHSNLAFRTAAP